ncbi:uncharacterized protein LOC119598585 isoform X1 [Penaeus monodon]|uniref:uncharacterized protein LOC119598585 isoform X1 n=1 Tax=Penaeus monodon TaxID=6687 RepID=UPI0018A76AF9|nr:uncharacterized protein LOC119598585 isoform X1 [Penaeus monodon]
MSSGAGVQLRLSLWRHWLSHLRQWPWIVSILVVAVLPFLLLVLLKMTVPPIQEDTCHFLSRSVSSRSSLVLMQSFVCSLPNNCHETSNDDTVDYFPGAAINSLLNDTSWMEAAGESKGGMLGMLSSVPTSISRLTMLADLLKNPLLRDLMENGLSVSDVIHSPGKLNETLVTEFDFDPAVVSAILGARINMSRVMSLIGYRDVYSVVCSPEQLGQFLVTHASQDVASISASLCSLSPNITANITRVFTNALDAMGLFNKVSDVLGAIGGYEAESLVQQLGAMLASLGRLESLAPLASTFSSLSHALQPITSAITELTDAGWTMESMKNLISVLEGLVADPQLTSLGARLLQNVENLTSQVNTDVPDPWKNILIRAGEVIDTTGHEVMEVTEALKEDFTAQTALALVTSLLPAVMGPETPNVTSLGAAVDDAQQRLPAEAQRHVVSALASAQLLAALYTNATRATSILVPWVISNPPAVNYGLVATFSNHTLLQKMISENTLSMWVCSRESWADLSDAGWQSLSAQMCSDSGRKNLQELRELINPYFDPDFIKNELPRSSVNGTAVVEEFWKSYEASQALNSMMTSYITSVRRKRSLGGLGAAQSEMPAAPPEVIRELKDAARMTRRLLKNVLTAYSDLLKSELEKNETSFTSLPRHIKVLLDPNTMMHVADATSSVVEVMIQLIEVTSSPWKVIDLVLHPAVEGLLQEVLPTAALDVVQSILDFMENNTISVPAPVPQIVQVLNASQALLTKVKDTSSPWGEMQRSLPYSAGLLRQAGILPRLLALPYLWLLEGVPQDAITLLSNATAWRTYPCGETSLATFFPASPEGLPTTWASLDRIKAEVRQVEDYLCHNYSVIVSEVASDAKLTNSVRALVEDMRPGAIEISGTIELLQTLPDLVMSLDLSQLLQEVTTPGGVSLQQEFADSFAGNFPRDDTGSVLVALLDKALRHLAADARTAAAVSSIRLGMSHAQAIARELTTMLEAKVTLAAILGVPDDYPPLALLQEDPAGTASFLVDEIASLAMSVLLNNKVDFEWVGGLCNRSKGVSSVVQLACFFLDNPQPPVMHSNLTAIITTAVESFANPNGVVPQVETKDVLDSIALMVDRLRGFDVNRVLDLGLVNAFFNASMTELEVFKAELLDLQKQWLWKAADAAVSQNKNVSEVARKAGVVLTYILQWLPASPDNVSSLIPEPLLNLHHLLNTTWIDLLDGFHHNLMLNPGLVNLSLPEICSSASNLQEPSGGAGNFLGTVESLCQLVSDLAAEDWLQMSQLLSDLETDGGNAQPRSSNTRGPNSQQSVTRGIYDLGQEVFDRLRAGLEGAGQSVASDFLLQLQSYLSWGNWEELLARIQARKENSTLSDLMPPLEMLLRGLEGATDPNAPSHVIRAVSLKVALGRCLLADNIRDLLAGTSTLRSMAEAMTSQLPYALRDVVVAVAQEPKEVAKVIESLSKDSWASVCQKDLEKFGQSLQGFKESVCQVNPQAIAGDFNKLLKIDVLQGFTPINLEEVLNASLNLAGDLKRQASLLQKFEDPVTYLGLGTWLNIHSLVFNVTADEMWENSTMIIATALGPLVNLSFELSPEETEGLRKVLAEAGRYLKGIKFYLALARGGDTWQFIREVYVDKPVVVKFFDIVEKLPDFLYEHGMFYGNFTVMSQVIQLGSDTPCNLLFFLLDGYRDLMKNESAALLREVFQFVCDAQQLSLLQSQLIPTTPPVIANVTMEVDAATLGLLVDHVAWDVVKIGQGRFFEGDVQLPLWLQRQSWEKVLLMLEHYQKETTIQDVVVLLAGLGLDAARLRLDQQYIVPAAGLVFNLASRFVAAVDETTGELDLEVFTEGLGSVTNLQQKVVPMLADLVALALWFPESKMYYGLLSGVPPMELYENMCKGDVKEYLLHPSLSEARWQTVQELLCTTNSDDLQNDLAPLFNTTPIVDGIAVNWALVGSKLEKAIWRFNVEKLAFLNVLDGNPYFQSLENITAGLARGLVMATASVVPLVKQGPTYEMQRYAEVLISIMVALEPISKPGSPRLSERLQDPDQMQALLQEYTHAMQNFSARRAELQLQYQLHMGSVLVDGVEAADVILSQESAIRNASLADLLADFRTSVMAASGNLVPGDLAFLPSFPTFVSKVMENAMANWATVVRIAEEPLCESMASTEQAMSSVRFGSVLLVKVRRHLALWDQYVDFICDIDASDLDDLLTQAMEEFGWPEDVAQVSGEKYMTNTSLDCPFVFNQSRLLRQEVDALVTRYIQDEAARARLQSCVKDAVNSTAWLQLRGLIKAAGDVMALGPIGNLTTALTTALSKLSASSSTLRALNSRLAVRVPFASILVRDFEEELNMSAKIVAMIKNDLLVDVNRIYGTDSHTLAALLTSVDNLKKVIRKRGETGTSGIAKRNTDDMEELFQAIQAMGADVFSERILQNVNHTYLLAEIDRLRIEALLTSDWLAPVTTYMTDAVSSLSDLSELGAVMDISKIISGEVDPVSFLTGSVQLLQMKMWENLGNSFLGILRQGADIIAGSKLEDDLMQVVKGITGLQAASNLGTMDFTIPTTALITNWTAMAKYLTEELDVEELVVEALSRSELNLMAVLSLEDVTLEEVICEASQVIRVVTLAADSPVTPANLSASLCHASDAEALAATFLQHLDLGPLIQTLTKFGINATLASRGTSLDQLVKDMAALSTMSKSLPNMASTFSALHGIMKTLRQDAAELNQQESHAALLGNSTTGSVLGDLSSPKFLERAGEVLCGRPLRLVPDTLGVLFADEKKKPRRPSNTSDICTRLYDELEALPGGKLILHFVKPLLIGKIYFTPDNAITRKIIEQANETFVSVASQRAALRQLREGTRNLTALNFKSEDLQKLEEALSMPWVKGIMAQFLPEALALQADGDLDEVAPRLQDAINLVTEFPDILDIGEKLMSCMNLQRFQAVASEDDMLREANLVVDTFGFLAGVVFEGVGKTGDTDETVPAKLKYAIRVDYEKTPSTFNLGPRYWRPGPYSNMAVHMRYHQGFLLLQEMMDSAILRLQYWTNNPQDAESVPRAKRQATATSVSDEERDMLLNLPVYTKQQPYPCYEKDEFLVMMNESPVMSLVFSFVVFTVYVVFLIRHLIQERQSRNKQVQEVMGLRAWVDLLAWLFFSVLLLLVLLLVLALLIKLGNLQPKAEFGVLLAFLLSYGVSIVSFCYLVSCVVPGAILGVFVGVMALLVFNVPFISISVVHAHTPLYTMLISCLLPPSAFGFGFRVICQYELLQTGATFANLWTPPLRDTDMTLGLAIVMLLADTLIFFVLAVIISILKNGTLRSLATGGRPPLLHQASFSDKASLKRSNDFTFNIFHEDTVHPLDVDPGLKQSFKKGLSIVGLRRIYENRGASKVAVDNLNLELYEGQIMALLGHNGAGKTTVISMITRELRQTAGNISVYGHDIRTSWDKARKLMGMCPQKAVLFPLMTVRETLAYYTRLKGTAADQTDAEVNSTLINMGLYDHRDHLGRQLSEGLRRRLCMSIAFVGGSKMVILDEPTSGVDPAARAAMWEVISNHRSGRTILLTTHHLDEAETLADRVAILHQGRLLCVGSPLALKSEYGSGYSITLSNRRVYDETEDGQYKGKPGKDGSFLPLDVTFQFVKTDVVLELAKKYAPNARLLEAVNAEVTYSIPMTDGQGNENRLPELFGELEGKLEELGFASMEIRPTNLEDVIIALNAINAIEAESLAQSKASLEDEPQKEEDLRDLFNFRPLAPRTGVRLSFQRLLALLFKRLLHHGRDLVFYIQMFVLPLVFICLAMLGSWCRPAFETTAPLEMSPHIYSAPSTSFVRQLDRTFEPLAEEFLRLTLGTSDGTGQWSTCPSSVANTNPGLPHCNMSGDTTQSLCRCNDDVCSVDVTNQPSLNDWILGTRWQHVQNRYGGLSLGVEDPRSPTSSPGVTVWYDNSGYHALPAYLNALTNARLSRLLGDQYEVTTVNNPVKFSKYGLNSISLQQHVADLGIGLLILVALTVVCSSTAGYVVGERARDERRVLYVAGVSRNTYWLANMIWDVSILLLNIFLTVVVLVIFNQQQFVTHSNLGAFFLLALLYGLSILPIFYLTEGLFRTETAAVFSFFCGTFSVGLISTLLLIVCEVYTWVKELKYDIGSSFLVLDEMENVIKYLFLIFPPFTFACGIKSLSVSYTKASIMARFGIDIYTSPFSWDPSMQGGLGIHYLALAIWVVVGVVLLHGWNACVEPLSRPAPSAPKATAGAEEDKDVAAERIKIQCGGASLYDTVLRMVGLGRDFASPPTSAVSSLYLALKRGECFSLLGLNGAGKTTTFRCLTGDLRPSRGQILINGIVLNEALSLPRPVMSYCPQNDPLDPNITPREALFIMALVRGFRDDELVENVDRAIKQLGLSNHEHNYIRYLSGGTMRKVSLALALIGNPPLVLLDEPTTGMDPASRRIVWRAVQSVTQDGRTVLLTSHSMDEVNHLSHRMAIMVNGYLVCMGSPHYLKYKLGDKYTIRIKAKDIEDLPVIVDYLRGHFNEVLLKEQHHLSLVAEVSRRLPLRLIFDALNSAKLVGVTEYDVSQTTLNEVFRLLTSHQGDGQVPPSPTDTEADQTSVPMHLSNLSPAGVNVPDSTFQSPSRSPYLSPEPTLTPDGRRSMYDNVEDGRVETYATVGRLSAKKAPTPEVTALGRDSPTSQASTADESPEEEWTHL